MPLITSTHHLHGTLDDAPIRVEFISHVRRPPAPGQVEPDFLPANTVTVEHGTSNDTFTGEQITTSDVPIGTLLTVTLFIVPDLGTTTLSVLIPPVGTLPATGTTDLHTIGIRTLLKSSLFPPADQGQAAVYTTIRLRGTQQTTDV